jgi:uncharacterized protein (DUF362 family)
LLSDDPVAADAALARSLGFEPPQIRHIQEASHFLGNIDKRNIMLL